MVNDGDPKKSIYFNETQRKKNKPLGFMIRNKDLFTVLIDDVKKNIEKKRLPRLKKVSSTSSPKNEVS